MIEFFAHYDEEGNIIGLYSTQSHELKDIPEPRIEITELERDEIVLTPSRFSICNNKLMSVESSSISEETARLEYKKDINSGYIYDNVCYYSDDESSAHITQCLIIKQIDSSFTPYLRVVGNQPFIKVNDETLVIVAKGINRKRTRAKIKLVTALRRGH